MVYSIEKVILQQRCKDQLAALSFLPFFLIMFSLEPTEHAKLMKDVEMIVPRKDHSVTSSDMAENIEISLQPIITSSRRSMSSMLLLIQILVRTFKCVYALLHY